MDEDNYTNYSVEYDLYLQALAYTKDNGEISSPMLQRQFSIPYHISATLMDLLELNGIIEEERSPNGRHKIKNNEQKILLSEM